MNVFDEDLFVSVNTCTSSNGFLLDPMQTKVLGVDSVDDDFNEARNILSFSAPDLRDIASWVIVGHGSSRTVV